MKLLKHAGFVPYLAIAFINASVDLAHKITIQNVLLKSFSGESLVVLTALINAMILLPFIFLFSPSAFINDKFTELYGGDVCRFLCANSDLRSTKCCLFAG